MSIQKSVKFSEKIKKQLRTRYGKYCEMELSIVFFFGTKSKKGRDEFHNRDDN